MSPVFKPKDKSRTEHRGSIDRIVFSDPSQPFVIAILNDGATVCGDADADQLAKGTIYRFLGRWTDDEKRGYRFRFSTFVVHAAHSRAGVTKYLCEVCEGVGQKTASRIYDKFGGASVETLRTDPAKVADACNLEPGVCDIASAQLAAHARFEDTRIDLFGLFAGRGFHGKLIEQAITKWGVRAPTVIRRNPFALLGMTSAGFKRCDRLWSDLKLPANSLKRAGLCAWNVIRNDGAGHTWIPASEVASRLAEAVPGANIKRALRFAIRARKLKKYTDNAGQVWLGVYHRATSEERIAAALERLSRGVNLWPTDRVPVSQTEGDRLPSAHQIERLKLATAGPVGMLLGGPGTGKAQPLDAKILTPSGWKQMGDLKVGDVLVHPCGGITNVTAVHPQGVKPINRVRLSDGTATECCDEHLWYTIDADEERRGNGVGSVKTTATIRGSLKREMLNRPNGRNLHRVPLVLPPDLESGGDRPVDPYLLGVLLGDGTLTTSPIRVCTTDEFIRDEIVRLVPPETELLLQGRSAKDYRIVRKGTDRRNPTVLNPLLEGIRSLGLLGHRANNKFVPPAYLFAPVDVRLALLQGLFDTDGAADRTNIDYCTVSKQLAEDVMFLVRSLGGRCGVRIKQPTYESKGKKLTGQTAYRISARLPARITPFRLPRKAQLYCADYSRQLTRFIEGIERVGEKECQCISVDAADGLYVTDDFIVTHNTHSVAYLLKEVIAEHGKASICAACPTGKAAVRITQALNLAGLDLTARTIHSTLEIGRNGHDGDGWGFIHNAGNPLPYQFVLVDEVSMNDTDLMADLLDACAVGTHVLLVGDPHQLPPVGHGAPLRDMIAAGVPHGELTQVRRNAGMIVHACARIKNGESFEVADKINLEPGEGKPPKNLRLMEARDEAKAREQLVNVLNRLAELKKLNDPAGFDPTWQTQVIVARNTKGEISRKKLNDLLHPMLNPDGYAAPGGTNPFKVGDKIICTRNSRMQQVELFGDGEPGDNNDPYARDASKYEAVRDPDNQPVEVYVANGEIGRVVAVAAKLTVARFSEGDALVKIPMGKQRDEDDEEGGGGDERDSGGRGCNFDHAYAVTGHKMQGSESPCVIVMGDEQAGQLTTREWLYTAISRASKLCVLIGKMSTFNRMKDKRQLHRRKTFLRETILETRYAEL